MEASEATDLDRERSVGEILSTSLSVYRHYPLLFATLAVGVIAPYELARLAVTGDGPLGSGGNGKTGALLLFELVYYVLVGPLISALHVHAVVEIGAGRRPTLGSVAVRGLRVLPVVAAAEIIAGILIALGFVAFIVPGIILALRWSVVAQTAAIDHEGWMPALRRSGRLAAGNYWHILRLLLAIGVLTFVVGLLAGAVTAGGRGTSVASVLIGIVVYTLIASFSALTLAILYFDLRARETGPRPSSISSHEDLPEAG
ncbi:MAG TPA: hypothetical protein VIJ33_09185 [Solirubrobacteraceae bacterium]